MDKLAVTAKKSFQAEAQHAAQMAFAREQRNYEMLIESFFDWISQRRNTTELIEPAIKQGRPAKGDEHGTLLGDFGFTRSQWHRRKKELAVSESDLHGYRALCIEQSRAPSLYGLMRAVSEGETVWTPCTCGRPHLPDCPARKV